MSETPPIPEKAYYKVAEVARLVGVKPYVLRYWESEFRLGRPQKNQNGQRLYHRRDIETLQLIRRWLYEEKVTIPNAKKQLRAMPQTSPGKPEGQPQLPLGFQGAPAQGEGPSPSPEVREEPNPPAVHAPESPAAGPVAEDSPPVAAQATAAPIAPNASRGTPASDAGTGVPSLEDAPPAQGLDARLRHVLLRDPTSRALVDQALREAQAILALAAERPPVR